MSLVMPAEWMPHECCFIAWPGRDQVLTKNVAGAQVAHAQVAASLVRYEPVVMLVHTGYRRQAETLCDPAVEIRELPVGNFWIRDSGPLFAIRDGHQVVAVDFAFNSWGDKLPPYRGSIGERLCRRLGIERRPVPLVLEGGSIAVDGAGTLIAVESSILNANRNPGKTRTDFEDAFRRYLGIERTVWLPRGLPDDKTDGHADNVVAFVGPGRVLCQTTPPENRRILREAGLEVIDVDLPTKPVRYLNFYVGNGCVLVPTAGARSDEAALALIAEAFPERDVVGIEGLAIAAGGGGIHCITQQQPRVPANPAAR
jgi:agmatine deiminase